MGHTNKATCIDCGNSFEVHHGGGFSFHLLRCDQCGISQTIGFKELGELHLRYLKGLSGPYCLASSEHDEYVRKHVPVEPIGEAEYDLEVERIVGGCKCGGTFTFKAPPRCPQCRSSQIEESRPHLYYD
jgi:hypothetical protein